MIITAHSLLTTYLNQVLLLSSTVIYSANPPMSAAPAILVTVAGAECGFSLKQQPKHIAVIGGNYSGSRSHEVQQ